MALIDEFPDEPKYTIKMVCSETGIRPVTLRAWERRHEILTPYRAENRYRLYSERDVAILRWVKSRIEAGLSIGNAVHELRAMQNRGRWPEAVPQIPVVVPVRPAQPPDQFSRELYQALLDHEEGQAGDILREADSQFDLLTVCEKVITPCLFEIGEAWYRGEIRVATEHFASAFLRGKLLAQLQAYPVRRSSAYILVGCAPSEHHEIGSLMLAVLLRSHRYRVEYLGADVALEDLVEYARFEHPALICLSATGLPAAAELQTFQEKLDLLRPAPLFGYGGRAFNLNPDLCQQVRGHFLGETFQQSIASVHSLIARSNP
ncbi:MAG TPA: MerR family transcriptional regulator [Anaerolineales bacterium]